MENCEIAKKLLFLGVAAFKYRAVNVSENRPSEFTPVCFCLIPKFPKKIGQFYGNKWTMNHIFLIDTI